MAEIGLGIAWSYEATGGSGSYTPISGVIDASPPAATVDVVESTNHGNTDGFKTYIAGLADGGEFDVVIEWINTAAINATLHSLMTGRVAKNHRLTFSSGAKMTASCIITSIAHSSPIDDRVTKTVTLKVSGAPTWTTS